MGSRKDAERCRTSGGHGAIGSGAHQLIGSGQLRSVLIGRRRLIPEQAICDFIAQLGHHAGK
jgi:hypothetical protein